MLLIFFARGVATPEDGLVVAGGAINQDGRSIFQGNLVCSKVEDKGPYVAVSVLNISVLLVPMKSTHQFNPPSRHHILAPSHMLLINCKIP